MWGAGLEVGFGEEVAHFVRRRGTGFVTDVYAPFRLVPPTFYLKVILEAVPSRKKSKF